jgi:hypothetical protein
MPDGKPSFKAELLWARIPPAAQERILAAVWCVQCRTGVRIVDYCVCEIGGDIVLDGRCAACGGRVRRHVEGS